MLYIAFDRPDIQFAVKELCPRMSAPTGRDWTRLKRLGRYLLGCPRVRSSFAFQETPAELFVWTDTDHAGCTETRKSTSGGVVMFGSHCLKSWSSTQAVVSLSSGEAEFYGLVRGGSQGLGIQSMFRDMGVESLGIRLLTDASAAKGIASRKGLGKVKHLDVSQLWIQDRVANGDIEIVKINGNENIADILTKHVNSEDIRVHLQKTRQTITRNRHEIAPAEDS